MRTLWKTAVVVTMGLVLLSGCQAPDRPVVTSSQGKPASTSIEASTPVVQPDKKDEAVVPISLQHEAYHYMGLTNFKPLAYKVTQTGRDEVTGVQTTVLDSATSDSATFTMSRTDGLAQVGDSTVKVDAKGVWTMTSSLGKTDKPTLEIIADPKPGAEWDVSSKINANGQDVELKGMSKVVGIQSVQTKGGTFDALLITAKGVMKIKDQSTPVETSTWYVKDIGWVKMVTQMNNAGKTVTLTIELSEKP